MTSDQVETFIAETFCSRKISRLSRHLVFLDVGLHGFDLGFPLIDLNMFVLCLCLGVGKGDQSTHVIFHFNFSQVVLSFQFS